MSQDRFKGFARESLTLAGTGIGISVLSGLDETGASSALASGVGKIAPLIPFKTSIGVLSDINKKLNKRY